MKNNRQRFQDEVRPPAVLGYSARDVERAIEEIITSSDMGDEGQKCRDQFCFVFQNKDDMETFMAELDDVQHLKVNAMG